MLIEHGRRLLNDAPAGGFAAEMILSSLLSFLLRPIGLSIHLKPYLAQKRG